MAHPRSFASFAARIDPPTYTNDYMNNYNNELEREKW